jgi:hypothetical protein
VFKNRPFGRFSVDAYLENTP